MIRDSPAIRRDARRSRDEILAGRDPPQAGREAARDRLRRRADLPLPRRVPARREPVGRGPGPRAGAEAAGPWPRACWDPRRRAGRQLRDPHPLRRPARHRDLLLGLSAPSRREPRLAVERLSRQPRCQRAHPRAAGQGFVRTALARRARPAREPAIVDALRGFREFGAPTREESADGVRYFANEFWTARQRQAHSLHEISYRACFKPQLPRFFIDRLTEPGDVVHDPFMGRGTTPLEAALAGRAPAGGDVNPLSAMLVAPRLDPPPLAEIAARLAAI